MGSVPEGEGDPVNGTSRQQDKVRAAAAGALCPPHHWEVTVVRQEGIGYYHHRCLRCGTEKDQPINAESGKFNRRKGI